MNTTDGKITVHAPYTLSSLLGVNSVQIDPKTEEIEWHKTLTFGGEWLITGYTIKTKLLEEVNESEI